jgi:hypothetical protein
VGHGNRFRGVGLMLVVWISGLLAAPPAVLAQRADIRPLLTVQGPNDGEPLNNWTPVSLEVRTPSPAYLIVFGSSRCIYTTVVMPGPSDAPQSVLVPVDTTRFPNGPLVLSFYLLDLNLIQLLLQKEWTCKVANPVLEPIPPPQNGLVKVRVRGVPGDQGYLILAGNNPADLLVQPAGPGGRTQPVASGQYGLAKSGSAPESEIVLNVDEVIRSTTSKSYLVLWSFGAHGKWSHSKVLPIQIFQSEAAPRAKASSSTSSTTATPKS